MLLGHGDDIHAYGDIRVNFSSNIYCHFSHEELYDYLREKMPAIANYPEAFPASLAGEIAQRHGIRQENVSVTNGATEAIYLIAQLFHGSRSTIIQPTFAEYHDACRMYGHSISTATDIEGIADDAELVWICNPNNPTGEVADADVIQQAVNDHPDTLFIIDASYAHYTMKRTPDVKEMLLDNVLMLHSMTKEFGIPGLRLGYVTACASLINRLTAQRMPWSVNQLAIDAAHFLLDNKQRYALDLPAMMQECRRMAAALSSIGIGVHHSDTHMLLCQLPEHCHLTATALKGRLAKEHGLLIRDASNFPTLTPQHFRIAVQRPAENDMLLEALKTSVLDTPT